MLKGMQRQEIEGAVKQFAYDKVMLEKENQEQNIKIESLSN
jgi:hypothetical protein